jgi:hypothetical protein
MRWSNRMETLICTTSYRNKQPFYISHYIIFVRCVTRVNPKTPYILISKFKWSTPFVWIWNVIFVCYFWEDEAVTTHSPFIVIVKVNCTPVQALRPCTGRTARRGSRGIALHFYDRGTRMGVRGQRHAPAALYSWERPGTHCTGGWVGPRAGLDRCGKSRPHRIRYPDRPARSQSLYQLRYPAHLLLSWRYE